MVNRRDFVKYSALGATTLGVLGVTSINLMLVPYSKDMSLSGAIKLLSELESQLVESPAKALHSSGEWQPAQIFNHAAQSVEYSFSNGGYPEHNPDAFKHSVGALAFSLFASNKAMTHNLSEAIPGAPHLISGAETNTLDANTLNDDTLAAVTRLKQSLINFQQFEGELHPHFAYGDLTKAEYELAHVMHLHNHMSEIYLG